MNNRKKTKRALLSSVVSLILCFTMLLSTTFAWFTDNASTGVNTIQSGKLDVMLVNEQGESIEGKTLDFVKSQDAPSGEALLWEPGVTYQTEGFNVKNNGNLWLKFKIAINGINKGDLKLLDVIDFYLVNDAGEKINLSEEHPLKPGATYDETLYLAGHMDENAGNEYQNRSLSSVGITVYATQYTAEYDSYDNLYDLNAAYGTAVDDTAVGGYITANGNTYATLEEALLADVEGTLHITINGTTEWTTGAAHGSTPFVTADGVTDIVIEGVGANAAITAIGAGVGPIGSETLPVTFKNLTFVDETESYAEDSWEFTYLEFRDNLTFENCTFTSGIMLNQDNGNSEANAVFTDCSFYSEEDSVYCVWVGEGTAAFENCTFAGTRGLKIHEDYGSDVDRVTVDNCEFGPMSKKPGVAIGTVDETTVISITNNTFAGCQAGEQGNYKYETDTAVENFQFTDENNIVVNAIEIADAEGLVAFAEAVNSGATYAGELVTLTADIDLAGVDWTPIGTNADNANKFKGTFDGQGYTISNLTVNQGEGYHAAGFFGALNGTAKNFTIENASITNLSSGSATDNGTAVVAGSIYTSGKIDNVHVVNAEVNGNRYVAGIAGYVYGSITNCSVDDTTITATPDNLTGSYDNGDKVGGIAGYFVSENTYVVSNNSVADVEISGYRDMGGIAGCAAGADTVTNNTAENVTLTIDQATYSYGAKDANAGGIVGRITAGALGSGNTECDVVISEVVKAASGESLADAMTGVTTDAVTLVAGEGTYEVPAAVAGKDVTIIGEGEGTVIDCTEGVGYSNADITFKNLKIQGTTENYKGLQHTSSVTYVDCVIDSCNFLYAETVEFVGCTFKQTSSDAYNIWTYSAGNVTFTDCTFESAGKSVLIYCEGGAPDPQYVTFNDCDFYASAAVEGKAAIEIESTYNERVVEINNCTATGFGKGSVSGNSLWNHKAGSMAVTVTVNGVKQ